MTTPAQSTMGASTGSDSASRILIVDDEEIIRALLSEILSDEGFEITTASDGKEAIDLLNKQQFDLVISDMVMPGVGGIEVLQEAFRIDPDYAVIIVTGYPSVDTAVKLVNLGAADYITKPFNVDTIKITVAKVLEMKRMHGGPPEAQSNNEIGGVDAATGVYSQSIFFQLLSNEVSSSKLRNQECGLLVIGVDDIQTSLLEQKPHMVNQLLRNVVDAIKRDARRGDTIGRTKENQFGIVLPQTSRAEAAALSKRICARKIGDFTLKGGVACFPKDGVDANSLLIAAHDSVQAS